MAKAAKVQYQCDQCGATYPKWAGQCSDCGAWNSLSEARVAPPSKRPVGYAGESGDVTVRKLSEVGAETQSRINTGISELNRVLGTGLVEGSVVLLGGDPGIGKS
ncbi:DNA repair protein RadA, partial [Solemya velum gill symbiont]